MKNYIVSYREYQAGREQQVIIRAKSKEDAFAEFFDNNIVYSSWVTGYIRKDGTIHYFKTCEGNAY